MVIYTSSSVTWMSVFVVVILLATATGLSAQEAERVTDQAIYRQFDFWIGTWDVYNPQDVKVGENVIRKLDNGALLLENWTSTQGTTGHSMNFYDPARSKWRQIWVDDQGTVIDQEGAFRDGVMHFEGEHIYPDKEKASRKELIRMSFTPLADGQVRQFIEQSKD